MRRLALALLLLVLAAPSAHAEETLEALVAKLKSKTATDWSPAYMELNRRRDPKVIPLLLEAIPDLALSPQGYAVYIIANIDKPALVKKTLRKLTTMEQPYVRARALRSLYDKGERGLGGLAKDIVSGVQDDITLGTWVVNAFTYIREDAGVKAVMLDWLKRGPPDQVYTRLAYWFHLLPDRTDVIPTMQAALESENAVQRATGAGYLLAYGPPGEAAANAKICAEAIATGEVSYACFIYIEYLLSAAPGLDKVLLDALAERIPEETGHFVGRLLRLLAKHDYSGVRALAKELLDSDNKDESKAAFEVLSTLSGGFSADTLAQLLASDDLSRRVLAAVTLRRMDDYSGLPVVLDVLKTSQNLIERRDAVQALGGFRVAEVVEPLLEALSDTDSIVRSYAFSALTAVWNSLFPYRRLSLTRSNYQYNGPAAQRSRAIETLRGWWNTHKNADW